MRKVVAYHLLSLDGVAEDCNLFILDWDEELDANLARVISSQDTVLLGHRMFEEWSQFWPPSDIEPFASFINNVEKFVATSSPLETTWTNTSAVKGYLGEFVTDLKVRDGGDIGVHGSIELTKSLLRLGLVDELSIVIAPGLFMTGRHLFDDVPATRLTLLRGNISSTGHLLVDYEVQH